MLLSNGDPLERGTLDGGKRHYAVWRDPAPQALLPVRARRRQPRLLRLRLHDRVGAQGGPAHLRRARQGGAAAPGPWMRSSAPCAGTRSASGASTISTCSTSSPCPTSTWGRWRTRASTSSTTRLILASPETATDASFAAIERVIAHEYFHNWTGNRITCRDWFQLCLKEGLTVFRDQEFCADQRSATVRAHPRRAQPEGARSSPRTRARWPIRCAPDRYIEINNFYTATVYNKGAEVVRMLQTLLGREGFRKGMDLYFERHDGQAATVEDFVTCFEDATGKDLAAVHDLVLPGRHARARLPAQVRCARQDRRPHHRAGAAAHAGRAQEEAAAHPGAAGPARRQRPGPRPHAGLRRAARGRRHRGQQAHRDLPLPRRALAAGALAAARLLGARQPDDRPRRTRTCSS